MGANQNIDFSQTGTVKDLLLFFVRAEPRQLLDGDWPVGKAVAKIFQMLMGQKGGRHQHHHLFSAGHCNKGSAHGDFRFSEANIPTDKPIHGLLSQHVASDGFDGVQLIGRFLEGEVRTESAVVRCRVAAGKPLACCASGIDVQQLGGGIADLSQGLVSGLLPLICTQSV